MKRSALIAVSAIMLTLPTPVQAESPTSASDIVVDAQPHMQRQGWLTTSGPTEQGLYTASIYIGDLDAATPHGWMKMVRRVSLGTARLCDLAQAQPHVAGFYDHEQRACWAETRGQASTQMERARQAAGSGKRVAMLSLAQM